MPSTAPAPAPTPIPILLLKSPSPSPSAPSPPDSSYTTIFSLPRYKTLHIPPLSTTPLFDSLLTFLSSLSSSSSSPPSITNSNSNSNADPGPNSSSAISALIFTSQRAVSSLASLLSLLTSSSSAASAEASTSASPSTTTTTTTTPTILTTLRSLRIPIFVVGRATASAVRKTLIDSHGSDGNGWMRGCWVEVEDAGTGEALAGIILRSLRARVHVRLRHDHDYDHDRWTGEEEQKGGTSGQTEIHKMSDGRGDGDIGGNQDPDIIRNDEDSNQDISSKPQRVIFITGETRRDVIPRVLREGGLAVEEIIVYKTRVDEKFDGELQSALRETEVLTQTSGVRWIVVFSGQGALEMLRGLGWLSESGRFTEGRLDENGSVNRVDENGSVKREEEEEERRKVENGDSSSRSSSRRRRRRRNTFVASIGPTTAEYLKTEFGLEVDVCAEKPTGEALREGIERFMRETDRETLPADMITPVIEKSHDFI